jgi:hypothetical protein
MKRPICLVQDEAFGVLHQVIAVPTQLVGNAIACAASQRGAEASVEGGGMASLFGPWQLGRTIRFANQLFRAPAPVL